MQPAKEAIALRITSRSRIAREQGRDIEDVFDELQSEAALAEKYGIDLALMPNSLPVPPPADPNA